MKPDALNETYYWKWNFDVWEKWEKEIGKRVYII